MTYFNKNHINYQEPEYEMSKSMKILEGNPLSLVFRGNKSEPP